MNGGPFRSSQPAERRVAARLEPTQRQSDSPQSMQTDANSGYREAPRQQTTRQKTSKKHIFLPIAILIVLILVAVGGWFAWTNMQNSSTAIDESRYQAVFFTNGQVYFGKLQSTNGGYLHLTDIFYLQTQVKGATDSENPQKTTSDQNDVQLIKLGNEIHGPEDMMVISKDQVLFYENLKTDGKVAQSIAKYKQAN